MTNKLRIGLLFGGRSVEHDISLRSARNIFQYIDKSLFDPVLIGISKEGRWHLVSDLDQSIDSGPALTLSLGHDHHSFQTVNGAAGTGKLDVIFPVLHGTDGEDGSIQGMLQAVDLPFAGSGVLGSAVAMDKLISKRLLIQAGIPTSKHLAIDASQSTKVAFDQVVDELGLPFMVKPVSLGSSVGVSKVKTADDFQKALKGGLHYDQGLILEEYISGRELECAVLGNKDPEASDPGEIVISPRYEFYTYDAKYQDPQAVEIKIPAVLDPSQITLIKELSLRSYKALGCEDFARVDLFLADTGEIFINEINTIPGFTNSSMFPSLWAQHGITYTDLITRIIELARERYKLKNQLTREYQGG